MKQYHKVRLKKAKSSVFDLSHERKLTMNMGDLVPNFLSEVIPSDKFRVNMEALVRFQPLQTPMMHRVNVYQHFFFVPYRLIWNEFEDFITGGKTGKMQPNFPKFVGDIEQAYQVFNVGSLADHLGVPVTRYPGPEPTPDKGIKSTGEFSPISQLPFRAYQLIYNEYYRDPTLHDELEIPIGSLDYGSTDINEMLILTTLRKRCWEKDYFTSALPFAQRGDQVKIPITGDVDIDSVMGAKSKLGNYPTGTVKTSAGILYADEGGQSTPLYHDATGTISGITSDINDLRTSYAIQRWMEKNARGGYRYIEQILSHFGIKSSDARLQRPEYLGGGKMPVRISEVLQTSQTSGTPQGNMAGHGVTAGTTAGFNRKFEEHGIVLGIMSILPRTSYSQGLPKIFSKFDKFDYFFPEFAHLGEQEVKYREIYLNGLDIDRTPMDDETFGYQERYAEYRTMMDSIHGNMRTDMDFWHMSRLFSTLPRLNGEFVEANPTNRIFPVDSENPELQEKFAKVIVQTYADFKAIRPIPKFGTPL